MPRDERSYINLLVSASGVACPRVVYPISEERCYRCRYFRDLRETLMGEDVIVCDYVGAMLRQIDRRRRRLAAQP